MNISTDITSAKSKILLFLISGDSIMGAYFSRLAEGVKFAVDGNLVVVSELRQRRSLKHIVQRFCSGKYINIQWHMLLSTMNNLAWLFSLFLKIKNGEALCKIEHEGAPIGVHFYDSMLRRKCLPQIHEIDIKSRLFLLIEVIYYLACRSLVETVNPEIVMLPDNTYRQGSIYEWLLKNWKGVLLAGIDMNSVSIHKYECPTDYGVHCRTPDLEVLERLANSGQHMKSAEDYLSQRCLGNLAQHDVIRAYDSRKRNISQNEIRTEYCLEESKQIVLVMSHIFSDAPHAYPGTLYNDYAQWLLETCKVLFNNRSIELLVKEHPSAHLYGEDGHIESLLDRISLRHRLLKKDINTNCLFDCVDYIVTCGGTAAMEFAAMGVPVILASKPPYHSLGFCSAPVTHESYVDMLNNIHMLGGLDESQRRRALLSLYCINCYFGLDRMMAGFGSQSIYKGANFSEDVLYKELESTGPGSREFSYLVSSLTDFLLSSERNIAVV